MGRKACHSKFAALRSDCMQPVHFVIISKSVYMDEPCFKGYMMPPSTMVAIFWYHVTSLFLREILETQRAYLL